MPALSSDDARQRFGLPPEASVQHARSADGHVRAQPDTLTVVELESELESATWERPVAVAGTRIHLRVLSAFVGEGNPVEVVLRDARGRTLGEGAGAMHRDRAEIPVTIDRSAAQREPDGVLAAADVRLPDLGLEVVSAPLLVLPFAELTDARWDRARTPEAEAVGLSCRLSGSAAGVERLSREPAEIAVFVRTESGARPLDEPVVRFRTQASGGRIDVQWHATLALDRWELLSQADHDARADSAGMPRGSEGYTYDRPHLIFRVRLAGMEAESEPLAVDDWADLALTDAAGEPVPDAPYALTLADGSTRQGALDADGTAHEDGLPPGGLSVTYDLD